ncbi:MAG: hypothetical protein AB7K09_00440 [Planctomycetota bacterium]
MMTPDDYCMFREWLDRPPSVFLAEPDMLDELHPHDVPDDPEWPTPGGTLGTSYPQVRSLLQRLRHAQQVVCALTSVEMVLAVWDRWMNDNQQATTSAPRRAVKQTWEVLTGGIDWSLGLKQSVLAARNQAIAADARAASLVAAAAASAYSSANKNLFLQSGMRSDQATDALAAAAVDEAFQAWLTDRVRHVRRRRAWEIAPEAMRDEFHDRWWARCRCRLAFRNADSAELA